MEPPYKSFFNFKRRSPKDPCSFLGVLAVIFFVFISLGLFSFLKFPQNSEDFSLASFSKILEKQEKTEVFLNPLTKFQPESPELLFINENSIRSAAPAAVFSPQVLGALVAGFEMEDTRKVIAEYLVEPGDSLWSIADNFGISLDTVLWANNLTKNSTLKVGQKLIIPPVSGVIHHVKSGDTVSAIAQTYKGKADEIVAFNQLSGEAGIYVGDIIMVPGGVPPVSSVQPRTPAQIPLASSYFIAPVSTPYRITQGLHWYNAIDFGGKCGDPIYATASGEILKVALTNSTSRWTFGGAGNHITVLHPNGVVTMYGHIAASFVKQGDRVSQGQLIALMGGQPGTPGAGLSTGCHVHFGVSGARNPFTR